MRKLALIIVVILAVAAVAVAVFAPKHKPATQSGASGSSSSSTTTEQTRQSQDVKTDIAPAVRSAIMAQASNDDTLTQGDFTVSGTTEPVVGWIIATIVPSNPDVDTSKAILRRSGGSSLDLVAGPGTAFAKSDLDMAGVPAAVQSKLAVYNDATP